MSERHKYGTSFVYLVMVEYPDGEDGIVRVYSSMISAEIRKKEEQKKDDTNGYINFAIEKHEVN